MLSEEAINEQLDIYEAHVVRYNEKFRDANILPKNHDWRPYRWCSRDIVFSLMVVRHERSRNCLEVDVCLTAQPPQYYDYSGACVAMGFLLSEAYKCGTSMEIVFTNNVESRVDDGVKKGRVPQDIYGLAKEFGITLKHAMEGHITPFEARQIYMELAGFSGKAQEKVMKLCVDGLLTPERACFLVMGGVWTVHEAESIILGSKNPESIILSASTPEERHLYLNDVMSARGAILGGGLDRKLLKKELMENGQIVESEDEETELSISFEPDTYAKVYEAEEDCYIPWTGNNELQFLRGEKLVVLVRARSSAEIIELFSADLESLKKTIEKYQTTDNKAAVYYLVPRDFEEIPEDEQRQIKQKVQEVGAGFMMSPESVSSLDKEAMRRIETGRMVRHD